MGVLGGIAGSVAGEAIEKEIGGVGGKILGGLVSAIGSLNPFFEDGGYVKAKKGRPVRAIVHGGEFILPVGVKPTKRQKDAVKKRKAKKIMYK